MAEDANERSLLTEGVIIAAASALVYMATFLYEYGFCSYFEIPANLIDPSLATILVAAGTIGTVLASSLWFLGLTAPLFKAVHNKELHAYRYFFAYSAVVSAFGILLAVIYGFSWPSFVWYIGGFTVLALLMFGHTFLFNRHVPLAERFSEQARIQDGDPFYVTDVLKIWFGKSAVYILVVCMSVLGIAFLIGNGEASKRDRFLVLKQEPDLVVLRNYGSVLLTARFSRESKQLSNEFVVIRLAEGERIAFTNEVVGPLKVKPGSISTDSPAKAPIYPAGAGKAPTTAPQSTPEGQPPTPSK